MGLTQIHVVSYLEGGPLMWMLLLYLHVNQKSDYDMIWYESDYLIQIVDINLYT